MNTNNAKCFNCGIEIEIETETWAHDSLGNTFCKKCSADRNRKNLIQVGSGGLYLTSPINPEPVSEKSNWLVPRDFKLTDWTGLDADYQIRAVKKGRHNIAGSRLDVWFTLPEEEFIWYGVMYGQFTQVTHCRRTKQKKGGK